MSNVIYGKRRQEDGTYVEDMRFPARKFIDAKGDIVTKACFACKKAFTCMATYLEECEWETRDDVACCPGVKEE